MLPCRLSRNLTAAITRPSLSCQHLRYLRTRSPSSPTCGDAIHTTLPDGDDGADGADQQSYGTGRILRRPSELLVKALEACNLKHLIQDPPPWKVDLSYVNPTKHDPARWRAALSEKAGIHIDLRDLDRAPPSPQTIVARQMLVEHNDPTAFQVFGPQLTRYEAKYIAERGYKNADVKAWLAILTTENGNDAARILRTGTATGIGTGHFMDQPIPAFLPLTLLRRPHLGPTALRDIIIRLWAEIRRHERMPHLRHTLTSAPMFLLIVRLLRHARQSWPAALVTITQMFLHYFVLPAELRRPTHPTFIAKMRRQTFLYNKILSLLSLPTRTGPFRAVAYHQRAQFDVVGAMAVHDPPLNITREGFQAIVSVQLVHRKTPQERDWSQLKIKSWPPWKQDKTGLDAGKDQDYGTSRALQAMHRATEAGYAHGLWEQTAKILSGWDIDNSPTIQTRSNQLHRYLSLSRPLGYWGGLDLSNDISGLSRQGLWTARIEATRTVREAWACFLSYQDLFLTQPLRDDRVQVYNAMLLKLLAKEQEPELIEAVNRDERRSLEPGDAREVLPEPISPREITWVHTPPPTSEGLYREMCLYRIVIRDHTLHLLLLQARNLAQGLHYLQMASVLQEEVRCLLQPQLIDPVQLGDVPQTVFAAFLKLLCRFPSDVRSHTIGESGLDWNLVQTPFFHAVRLLKSRPGFAGQGLEIVSRTLDSLHSRLTGLDETSTKDTPTPLSWLNRLRLMRDLDEDIAARDKNVMHAAGFETLHLRLHERAISAALELKSQREHDTGHLSTDHDASYIDILLESTSAQIQMRFYAIAEGETSGDRDLERSIESLASSPFMPELLRVPTPQVLHNLVRLLGFLRDYRGILNLLQWMQRHEQVMAATADEPRNGRNMLRRTAIAARVFFERAWLADQDTGMMSSLAADEQMQQELETIVRGSEMFGEWPSEMDVWRYVEKGLANLPPGNE